LTTFDLDISHAGSTPHYISQIWRSWSWSLVKIQDHRREVLIK